MRLDQKNFGRLTEGYLIVIGVGVAITIISMIAFGFLLAFNVPWFSVPLIFVFLGVWIAASQWNELRRLRIVAGFVSSITRLTRITSTALMLNLKKYDFVHNLSKLITRGVIEVDIFPEVDAFGPKGIKHPESVPEAYQPEDATRISSHQRFATSLQWIGLLGTVIAIIYHFIGLLRYLGLF
ncbi:MAG: hypothetical protein ACFE89_05555 [Candidatus Hodarchaeota archaeon]